MKARATKKKRKNLPAPPERNNCRRWKGIIVVDHKEAPKRFAMVYSLDPDNALEWLTAIRKANRSREDMRLKIIEAIAKDPDQKVEVIAKELKVSPSAVKKVRRELVAAQGFHHKVTRRRKTVTS